jgi:hypothetical protein
LWKAQSMYCLLVNHTFVLRTLSSCNSDVNIDDYYGRFLRRNRQTIYTVGWNAPSIATEHLIHSPDIQPIHPQSHPDRIWLVQRRQPYPQPMVLLNYRLLYDLSFSTLVSPGEQPLHAGSSLKTLASLALAHAGVLQHGDPDKARCEGDSSHQDHDPLRITECMDYSLALRATP